MVMHNEQGGNKIGDEEETKESKSWNSWPILSQLAYAPFAEQQPSGDGRRKQLIEPEVDTALG